MSEYICSECASEGNPSKGKIGQPTMPKGWKKRGDNLVCSKCWKGKWKLRAITVPVDTIEGMEWGEFLHLCREAWMQAAKAKTYAILQLLRAEAGQEAGAKLQNKEKTNIYRDIREKFPTLASRTAACLARIATSDWAGDRFDCLVRGIRSPRTYKFPQPFPITAQAYTIRNLDGIITVAGTGATDLDFNNKRLKILLRKGSVFRRANKTLARAISEGWLLGELAIAPKRDASGPIRIRRPGGDQGYKVRPAVKICLYMPKEDMIAKDATDTLYVRTAREELLHYYLESDKEPRMLAFRQVKRRQREHDIKVQRFSEDMKFEKRWPKSIRDRMTGSQDSHNRRFMNFMDTTIKDCAAMLIGFAKRNGVRVIVIDMKDKSFAEHFPWRRLLDRITIKAQEYGITVEGKKTVDTEE